ncbi:MAG: PAS domain-containing protein [Methanoregula sp.]|uniref:PAS domain-containing protein n=1 Tax=Methanoregula sp. TaxID=2052170 RepID=UPI0025FA74D7|nr:PAS domain-containing protein [Methanoregula sp.]MCK9632459.1 PAS domain-containing protein [Methanoregula sp.]
MRTISTNHTLWLSITALLTVGIVLVSIYSLKNGYFDIFPYFYILPILFIAYCCPRYSVYFTVLLGWIFLGLVYLYGSGSIQLYVASMAFFYIFVSLGIVLSAFSGQALQERKYRDIFETSQTGIITFELETQKIRTINTQSAEILGYPPEELARQSFTELWFDGEQEIRFMKQIRQEEKITEMEVALRKKDRTVIWVLITAALTKEGLIVCSMMDVTASKRMKDELIESELRYRTLFDGASDAIILHDIDGKIFETNVIASRYLGYTKKELMHKTLYDLAVHPEAMFPSDEVKQFQARGHILFVSELKKKDGGTLPVEISSRITEYFGMPAVMSTVRDISGRRNP